MRQGRTNESWIEALEVTKMKANAALEANRTYEHIEKAVRKMLDGAEAKDAEEDRLCGKDKRGDDLPEDLQDHGSRLARLKECKELLEREQAEGSEKQRQKIENRQREEAQSGLKKRGRKPKEPDPKPETEAKANITDPDSRIMKKRSGYIQGYNGQAVVTAEQIIIAAELTVQENDVNQLHCMVKKAQENIADMGVIDEGIKTVLADAGYCSEAKFEAIDLEGREYFIAIQKDWKQG